MAVINSSTNHDGYFYNAMKTGAKPMNFLANNSVSAKALRIAALSLAMTAIFEPMEAWANGNIYYNFSFLGDSGNVSGQFEVQPGGGSGSFPDLIVGITGTVSGFPNGNGSFNTLLSSGTVNNNNYFSSSSTYVDGSGVGFQSNGVNFSLYYESEAFNSWILNPYTTDPESYGTLAISQ